VTEARRAALVEALPDDVDAILVTKLVNVRYLTGFTGSNGAVLIARDGSTTFATDGRYAEQVKAQVGDVKTLVTRTLGPDLVRRAGHRGVRKLAIERDHVTLAANDALNAAAGGNLTFADAGSAVERLRQRKDAGEIAHLRRACAVTDHAFHAVLPALRPGVTERAIAWRLAGAMRDREAEGTAFDSIVAFGPHSAIPHHQPTDRPLQTGDLVKLDFGALSGGYHADMTRTVVCGRAYEWQNELHAQVREVQKRCRAAVAVGAAPVELDRLARDLIAETGHDLVHGLGHGVGLEIHERPFLVPKSEDDLLAADMTVTVEPGVYLPGRGGVRIEDTAVVTPGGIELLTTSPRDLLET